jgi:hypothetical protein
VKGVRRGGRTDGTYTTYRTNMKRRAANLRAIAIEEMAFHLSPFTFHLSRPVPPLTSHESPPTSHLRSSLDSPFASCIVRPLHGKTFDSEFLHYCAHRSREDDAL